MWGEVIIRRWGVVVCLAVGRKDMNCCLVGNLLWVEIIKTLYSELGAATGTAALNHEAAFVVRHADAEAVSVAAFDFFGLVSALGHAGILAQGEAICHCGR